LKESKSSGKSISVISDAFARQIIGHHTGFGSSVQHFHPLISTGGILPLLGRWIELIYALPFLRVSREILTQRIESLTTRQEQPVSPVLNFLFNFSGQQNIIQSLSRLPDRTLKRVFMSSEGSRIFQTLNRLLATSPERSYYFQTGITFNSSAESLLSLSRAITLLHRESNEPGVSIDRPQIQTYPQPASERITPPITEQAGEISGEEDRRQVLSAITPYLFTTRFQPLLLRHHLLTAVNANRESMVFPFITRPVTTTLIAPMLQTMSESNETISNALTRNRSSSIEDRQPRALTVAPVPNQRTTPTQGAVAGVPGLNILNLTKIAPIYRTYPAMEIISAGESTRVIRETQVIEKEVAARQPAPPQIDVERLTEEVYQMFERRMKIERERRGL
jgi:hypothetical protein